MGKVKVSISMSLDGYVAGPDQSKENPLGVEEEEQLHKSEWFRSGRSARATDRRGGEVNARTRVAEGVLGSVGATIMGRNMFGGGPGPWGTTFSPTHAREALEMQGGTTFYFVTDGIESAPRAGAGGRRRQGRLSVGGGAGAVQQYLAPGLLDEIVVSIVPVMLGGGARLFDNLGDAKPGLEQIEAIEAPGVTHIRYARV